MLILFGVLTIFFTNNAEINPNIFFNICIARTRVESISSFASILCQTQTHQSSIIRRSRRAMLDTSLLHKILSKQCLNIPRRNLRYYDLFHKSTRSTKYGCFDHFDLLDSCSTVNNKILHILNNQFPDLSFYFLAAEDSQVKQSDLCGPLDEQCATLTFADKIKINIHKKKLIKLTNFCLISKISNHSTKV